MDCGKGFVVKNGHVNFTGWTTIQGNRVSVLFCNMGYKLVGGNSIECLANGTWTDFISRHVRGRNDK